MKRLFSDEELVPSDDVLWHSEYVKDKNNIGNETLVTRVIVCAKGLMLLGEDFKDFLFYGKKHCTYLMEALEIYAETPSNSIPICMEASRGKNAILGILEEYEGNCVWVKEDKGFRFLQPQESLVASPTSNPFLLPTMQFVKTKNGGTPRKQKNS